MQNKTKNNSSFLIYLIIFLIAISLFTCSTRKRNGCVCWDGNHSYATGSGACSHHGGVKYWTHKYWWDN